jgi:hypothetical protein
LGRAAIHAHYLAAHLYQLFRETAVATAQIQNPLTWLWIQQLNDGHTQIGYKSGMLHITFWMPLLAILIHCSIIAPKVGD